MAQQQKYNLKAEFAILNIEEDFFDDFSDLYYTGKHAVSGIYQGPESSTELKILHLNILRQIRRSKIENYGLDYDILTSVIPEKDMSDFIVKTVKQKEEKLAEKHKIKYENKQKALSIPVGGLRNVLGLTERDILTRSNNPVGLYDDNIAVGFFTKDPRNNQWSPVHNPVEIREMMALYKDIHNLLHREPLLYGQSFVEIRPYNMTIVNKDGLEEVLNCSLEFDYKNRDEYSLKKRCEKNTYSIYYVELPTHY